MSEDKSIKIAKLIGLEKKTREAKTEDELNGWQIVLKVDNGEYGDLFNVIGQRSSASEQLDLWDNPEPPKLEKYIALEIRPLFIFDHI